MAKKEQISANVDRLVYEWVLDAERLGDSSKTRIALAGFIALFGAEKKEVEQAMMMASLLDRGLATWEDVKRYAETESDQRGSMLRILGGSGYEGTAFANFMDSVRRVPEPRAARIVRQAGKEKPSTRKRQRGV